MNTTKNANKPKAKVIGEDGNVFNLLAICCKALRRNGQPDLAEKMKEEILSSASYDEALYIMSQYCELI